MTATSRRRSEARRWLQAMAQTVGRVTPGTRGQREKIMDSNIYVCKHCGQPYQRKRREENQGKTFCSRACAFAWKHDHAGEGKCTAVYFKQCKVCDTLFTSRLLSQLICSDECRKINARIVARASSEKSSNKGLCQCKECLSEFIPVYGDKHRTFCSDACCKRFYRRNRSHMMRAAGKGMEHISLARLFLRDGGKCQLCGKRLSTKHVVPHKAAPTVDHIVPLAKGGIHGPSNVQLACFACNSAKGSGCVEGREQLRLC